MAIGRRAFRAMGRWGVAIAAAAAICGPAAAQSPFPPVAAEAIVGARSTVAVPVPLQVPLATLAARYGSTTVFNTTDIGTILSFAAAGISMPVTVQKIANMFPTASVQVTGLALSIAGDARFTISAGTCIQPSGGSCSATATYDGTGPAGVATPQVRASVSAVTVIGSGFGGTILVYTYPLLADVVSSYLAVDLRVTIAQATATDPNNHTALWWNPLESGWGINIDHQGGTLFATLFTYDRLGAPLWLVMSAGVQQPGGTTYQGPLYRTTGPAFDSVPFTPIGASNLAEVGTMSIAFTDEDHATLTYGVDGVAVTKAIRRQVFGTRVAQCATTTGAREGLRNYQDLWWNPAESGWGLNLAHQDDVLFATLFTYGADGQGLWLVMSAGLRQADGSYAGDLYRTTGPPFDAKPFTPIGPANLAKVGTMTLRFSDGNHATLTYSVDGSVVTKDITRQVFASPVPACAS